MPRALLVNLLLCCLLVARANAEPTCALIDATKLPVTALLEARLLATKGAVWVERTQIDRLLGERNLQAAFGADGVQSRAALGELLKADILVLLRSAKNPDQKGPPLLDCVICETKRGLRLRTRTFPQERDVEQSVQAVESLVGEGLRKFEEEPETVVAVPPFLSEDLGYEFNYLQSAYAKLVEQTLLAQPGLLVVELGEAQAIGRELTLAAEDSALRKTKPPLYIFGRYRHDGVGAERRLQMSLRLVQSEQELALQSARELSPAEAPAWILQRTVGFLPNLQTRGAAAEADPAAEAKALAERGRLFLKAGSWTEALALFEASLLLNPNQEDVRRSAVTSTTPLIRATFPMDESLDRATRGIALGERGFEHLEAFLRTADEISKYKYATDGFDFAQEFEGWYWMGLGGQSTTPAEVRSLLEEARKRRRETLLRIAYARGKMGRVDSTDHNAWDVRALGGLPVAERCALILRLADEWKDLPDLAARLVRMTFGFTADNDPALQDLLRRLATSDRPELRDAAADLQRRIEKLRRDKEEIAQRRPPAEPTNTDPRVQEIKFLYSAPREASIDSSAEGERGEDIFSRNRMLFRLRKAGKLEAFFMYPELNLHMSSVIRDGKYVWLAGRPLKRGPILLAVDDAGKAIEIKQEHGLPNTDEPGSDLRMAPLGPGKVCVIGFSGQSWAAIADITGARPRVEVFFEAREVVNGTDDAQRENTKIVFTPTVAYTLRSADRRELRVIVGRRANSKIVSTHPLILDPEAKTARVAKFSTNMLEGNGDPFAEVFRDTLLFCEKEPQRALRLMQVKFPCEVKELLLDDVPEGRLAATEHGLHLIGAKWYSFDIATKTVTVKAENPPWYYTNRFFLVGETKNRNFGVDFSNTALLNSVFTTSTYGPIVKVVKSLETKFYRLEGANEP